MTPYPGALKLGTPATYRILISGCLNCSWSGQFGDMVISNDYLSKNIEIMGYMGCIEMR